MPFSFYKTLEIPKVKTTRMAIHMVDQSITYPRGVVEGLLVTVGKFAFTFDFVVLDVKEDEDLSIILGRPLLCTSHDLEDIH